MDDDMTQKVTGNVLVVGNASVGKTTIPKALDLVNRGGVPDAELINSARKTNTLEYEYLTTQQRLAGADYAVTLQFLIPPGLKREKGDLSGRSFEDVIEIFKPTIRRLEVVVFAYDLTSIESLHDLDYWINGVGELLNDFTHFILLGTHSDMTGKIEVTGQDIEGGLENLVTEIQSMRPGWKGNFAHLEVSNLTGENLDTLIFYLAGSVVSSRQMQD
jgi:hypothetical protein